MSARKKLYDSYRSIMLIGAGMGVSLVFYFIVVKALESRVSAPEGITGDDSALDLIRLIVYGASLMLGFVMGFIRGIMLRTAPGESADDLIGKLSRAAIVTLSICELPAVFGLVLYLVGRMYFDFYILLAFSLVLFFFYFPRYERWKAWMEKKAGPNWELEKTAAGGPHR